ncbi:cytidine deaminase-like protein [Paraphysoderma sedebokerense]|nr:cytidine deaminase-like protein [Paraphysoderma sedebokerense]
MTKYGTPRYFEVDKFYLSAIGSMKNYERILDGFDHTLAGFHKVVERYSCELTWEGATKEHRELDDLALAEAQHAMVLAHIASRRTDDPKIGVGAVIVNSGSYISLGWNGFPKKSQRHDYPRLGADEATENEELKYAYVLHAEQNALLHRRDIGSLENCRFYSTKYPCDECAPVIFDMNIKCIFTTPKSNPPMLISPTRPSTSQNSNSNTHNRESSNTSIQQLPTSQDQRKASLMFLPGLSHPDSTATFPPTSFSTSPSYPYIDTIMSNSQIKRNSSSFQVNAAYRGLTYNKLGSLLGSTNGSLWIFRINNPASGLSVNHYGISGSPPTGKTNERSQSIREETDGTNGKSE